MGRTRIKGIIPTRGVERDHLEDQEDGRIIMIYNFRAWTARIGPEADSRHI